MNRLAAAVVLMLLAVLAPARAGAEPGWWSGMGSQVPTPTHRPHVRPPFVHRPFPVISCCLGVPYVLPPPPVIVTAPPPILYVLPSPPSLAYIAPPRPEPAPEITLATGRWERHGNGGEYPYTWVWVGAAPAR